MKKISRHENGHVKVQTINDQPSRTVQSQKDSTDINKIMDKYHKTGMITHLQQKQGQYVDLSSLGDYQHSLQTVIDAQAAFMTLPSTVRKKFANDPQELLTFLSNPQNKEEAITLGLIQKSEPKQNDLNEQNPAPLKTTTP